MERSSASVGSGIFWCRSGCPPGGRGASIAKGSGEKPAWELEDSLATDFQLTPRERRSVTGNGHRAWENHVAWALSRLSRNKSITRVSEKAAPGGGRRGIYRLNLIRARTSEGRDRAKARGVKLGRKPKMTEHQKREAIRCRDRDGEPVREIARSYNVSHNTISRLTV